MTPNIIKWISVVLSAFGLNCCFYITAQPNIYSSFQLILALTFIAFPLSVLILNYYSGQLIKKPLKNAEQNSVVIVAGAIAIISLVYLYIIIFVLHENRVWQSFMSIGLDRTGQSVMDSRIGSFGIGIVLASWLMTSVNLSRINYKLIPTVIPLLFQIVLWILIYFARTIPLGYSLDTLG